MNEMNNSAYYTDDNVNEKIDVLQQKIASVNAHLGMDSNPTEIWEAGNQIKVLRLLIKSLDVDYYKKISTQEEIDKEK